MYTAKIVKSKFGYSVNLYIDGDWCDRFDCYSLDQAKAIKAKWHNTEAD